MSVDLPPSQASSQLIPDWLQRCAENRPQHLAVQSGAVRWSFAELAQQAMRLAEQLAALGVTSGSRVALLAANSPAFVACVHALTRLRAILVPLNTRLSEAELSWQLQDARVSLLLSDAGQAARAERLASNLAPLTHACLRLQPNGSIELDPAPQQGPPAAFTPVLLIDLNAVQAIMYTSGTTGEPKGVLITYGMHWWNAVSSALNLGHHLDDCWLACLPFFHIGGLTIIMRSVIYGITINVHEKFDPLAINRSIFSEGVTIISVVAVMLQRMLEALEQEHPGERYPGHLRCVLLGGGPAPRPLLEACAARGIPVVQTYGLTEACSQAATLSPAEALRKLGSAGRPLPAVQLEIRQDGRRAAPGEAGMIYLKGPTITPGYANRPEATREALQDGWLATGDIGYLDEEGYLYVLDRRSDLIISGGENIYPAEIEAALLSHPAVAEAGVCGQPDPQWGQVPIAFVRLHPDQTTSAEELLAHLQTRLARYKLPRAIHFVAELPRNSSGKLLRRQLPSLLNHAVD
ncbi:o-succinylbenzoate--CoA ligase [Thermogemmatispora sp.]|uniref:o-succinylbenzoate--CoA ligase n=1 Tax=Thermogemmatispora sp. TaxID=1968838 RepID=UPI001D214317|nr:o-succinylbenzoate--CoA ligase [Thermogemmatispora sp.]MBX5449432.1 o-succinylbenzoate--CoA ligase [Thermogemmatispora sp.]